MSPNIRLNSGEGHALQVLRKNLSFLYQAPPGHFARLARWSRRLPETARV